VLCSSSIRSVRPGHSTRQLQTLVEHGSVALALEQDAVQRELLARSSASWQVEPNGAIEEKLEIFSLW
jgi:hypothetical protein